MKHINIRIGKAVEIYSLPQKGIAVDVYAFGYRVRWYSTNYFCVIKY